MSNDSVRCCKTASAHHHHKQIPCKEQAELAQASRKLRRLKRQMLLTHVQAPQSPVDQLRSRILDLAMDPSAHVVSRSPSMESVSSLGAIEETQEETNE